MPGRMLRPLRWFAALITLMSVTLAAAPASATASTTVALNGAAPGRTFDGVGAISGGGGNSRLLIDYPEPYRSQVLDYLFKPGYGASLQILKVEIGGDANSTDGAEASHMHSATDVNCDRGYEWWLMTQAKARNPHIKLAGLAWAAPGWVGDHNFWSADMVRYLTTWLGCARSHHLTIDYLGGWNENGYDKGWYESLRAALDASGNRSVKIVGADTDWSVADDMVADPAFAKAVDIVGAHYPCEGGDGGSANTCASTANALATGKPLWASENGSQDLNTGAAAMIRSMNLGYLDAKMTAYINWPLVAALPPGLPFETTGLVVADQPWSGAYTVGRSAWVAAHVTQFTDPGWRYVDSASGLIGGDRVNGSYVTLRPPSGSGFSTVVETTRAGAPREVRFALSGGLAASTLHVYATNLNSSRPADWFVHTADVKPTAGGYSLTLQPGYVYTVSTRTGGKGAAAGPPKASFALPYADNFDHTPVGHEAAYVAAQHGAFEAARCGGGRTGGCLRQSAPVQPITWHPNDATPYALLGDSAMSDYTVSSDVMLEAPGSVELLGRYRARDYWDVGHIDAYYLRVTDGGAWSILRGDTDGDLVRLAGGTVRALGVRRWHTLSLRFQGHAITASVDHREVGTATDAAYGGGPAGLAVGVGDTPIVTGPSVITTPTGQLPWSGPGTVAGTTDGGQSAVHWTDPNAPAWTYVQFHPADAKAGGTYQASITLRGKGEVYLELFNGQDDADSRTVTLTDAPQTLSLVATLPTGAGRPPQFRIRTASDGPVDVYGTGASLVPVRPNTGWVNAQYDNLRITPGTDRPGGPAYELINKGTGRVLETVNRDGIGQGTDKGTPNQQWKLVGDGSGYLRVVNVATGRMLDARPGSDRLAQSGDHSTGDDWRFTAGQTGGYQLTDRHTGRAAQATRSGPVEQRRPAGTPDQQWILVPVPTPGATYALVNRNSGLRADVAAASPADNAPVLQWPDNGGANQHWQLTTAADGYVAFVNVNSGKALDTPGTAPDGQLVQRTATGTASQQWRLTPAADGCYRVVNRADGLALDVHQASSTAGAAVVQQTVSAGAASQQWRLEPIG